MALSSFVHILRMVYMLPLLVSCTLANRSQYAEPDSDGAREFMQWIERVGKKHRMKQEFARNELVGEWDPSIAQPDLSGSFPGLKQYSDWDSVVSPATYIVVDQNGFGNFRSIWEAINSIPNDINRRTRITIQVNAGTYRYPKSFLTFKAPLL